MQDYSVIVVGEAPPDSAPDPAVADIWGRTAGILRHFASLNSDEKSVGNLQFRILQRGEISIESPFHNGTDFCCSSYTYKQRIFYYFAAVEEYFWVTSPSDRYNSLSTLYLPSRRVALSIYPFNADGNLLAGFEALRARSPKFSHVSAALMPITVVGDTHTIHQLWNGLPALDLAVAAGFKPQMHVVVTQQPMGPLYQIFPELRGQVEFVSESALEALNSSVQMFTSLGARSVPTSTQARVVRVARRLTEPAKLSDQERYRALHSPIFWLSVKPPEQTCVDQAATLAKIIQGIHLAHPRAGFLINGVSYPWDRKNSSYSRQFYDTLATTSARTGEIIDELTALLPTQSRARTRIVHDVCVLEEVCWASLADFYFCHGGSMQSKIRCLHSTPGIVHCNSSFIAGSDSMNPPLEHEMPVFYLPSGLVIDDDLSVYTPLQLARNDKNYCFTDITKVIAFILNKFETSTALERVAFPSAPDDPRFIEDFAQPCVSLKLRVAMAMRSRDCDEVPKVSGAGQVRLENGLRVQIMHNGLRVIADGYCGAWMTQLIELCEGHHEAQEERMFHEVLRFLRPNATMIELGGNWSYYSLWFLQGLPGRRAVVLEPDSDNLAIGRSNAVLNDLTPHFILGMAGERAMENVPFTTENRGETFLPCFTVEQLMREHGLDVVDVLHCDIQGGELGILESCAELFRQRRVHWVFVSTHAEMISGDALTHQRCLITLQNAGAVIEAEHDVHESFSGDGLIVARFIPAPPDWQPVTLSRNRYSESLFRNPLFDLALARRAARSSRTEIMSDHSNKGTPTMNIEEAKRLMEEVPHWHHRFEIFPGLITPGSYDPAFLLDLVRLPVDMEGMRALDIGPSDGFYSMVMAQRGAKVTAVDYRHKNGHGFGAMEAITGLKFDYRQANVYDVDAKDLGRFDIVLFLGVLYHLPDMLRALDIIQQVTGSRLILETHYEPNLEPDKSVARYYEAATLAGDHTNFWSPNKECVHAMLRDSGFKPVRHECWGNRILVEASLEQVDRSQKMTLAYGHLPRRLL